MAPKSRRRRGAKTSAAAALFQNAPDSVQQRVAQLPAPIAAMVEAARYARALGYRPRRRFVEDTRTADGDIPDSLRLEVISFLDAALATALYIPPACSVAPRSVSYTHLTLPTIYSV